MTPTDPASTREAIYEADRLFIAELIEAEEDVAAFWADACECGERNGHAADCLRIS
jgi:hypothetical protein